jgi:tripartite-type tricarboxylate transporter receptor subunit TctC
MTAGRKPNEGHASLRTLALKLGTVAAAGIIAAGAASADEVDFSGETVRVIVPFGEGGAADIYARQMAAGLAVHLPGEPSVIVQNIGGAGGRAGANAFAREAEPDGLTVMATSPSTLTSYMVDAGSVEYDLSSYIPVHVGLLNAVAYTRAEVGLGDAEALEDKVAALRDYELVYGDSAPNAGPLRFILSLHLLDVQPQTVWGLSGGGPRRQAFERGEFQINYESSSAILTRVLPWVEDGDVDLFFQFGTLTDAGEIDRDPLFPDVPTFIEYYEAVHGSEPSGPLWNAWQALFFSSTVFNKAVWLPEGTPEDIVDAYTAAFDAMLEDPEWTEGVGESFVEVAASFTGPETREMVQEHLVLDEETIEALRVFLDEQYDADL